MNKFDVLAKVGEGAFASVYKVKRKEDNQIYAMKKIKLLNANSRDISNCLNEVRILASISNPYIIGYKEAIYDQSDGCLLLVTQFATGGDLTRLVKQYSKRKQAIKEDLIWKLAIQMLFGLKTLHKSNIFHRDIKGANIFLTGKQQIKLGDLNVSKISKSGLASTQTGTPYYASPQVWSDYPYNGKCDVWSMGCVLYELASFRPPFMANDINSLKKKIMTGVYDRIPSRYSEQLQSFIRCCLTVNPKERPSIETLLHKSAIRKRIYLYPNEKFNDQNFDNVLNKQNQLIQTIKIPSRFNFGNDLKARLPKSKYDNASEMTIQEKPQRNSSLFLNRNASEQKLPQIIRRHSSKEHVQVNIPKPRMVR